MKTLVGFLIFSLAAVFVSTAAAQTPHFYRWQNPPKEDSEGNSMPGQLKRETPHMVCATVGGSLYDQTDSNGQSIDNKYICRWENLSQVFVTAPIDRGTCASPKVFAGGERNICVPPTEGCQPPKEPIIGYGGETSCELPDDVLVMVPEVPVPAGQCYYSYGEPIDDTLATDCEQYINANNKLFDGRRYELYAVFFDGGAGHCTGEATDTRFGIISQHMGYLDVCGQQPAPPNDCSAAALSRYEAEYNDAVNAQLPQKHCATGKFARKKNKIRADDWAAVEAAALKLSNCSVPGYGDIAVDANNQKAFCLAHYP